MVKHRLISVKHRLFFCEGCFSQATNWCLVLWHFGSAKSLSSIQNLPWHSAMSRHIYVFSICLDENNAKAIEFLGVIKTTFPRIRNIVQERKEMFYSIKKLFLFFSQFSNLISWRRSFLVLSTDVCILFSLFFSYIGF